MNPTFQRLLDQATIDALHATQDTQDYVGNTVARQQRELQLEKFAELIVRECARVIDRGNGELSTIAETAWCNGCRDDILKHFGVEE